MKIVVLLLAIKLVFCAKSLQMRGYMKPIKVSYKQIGTRCKNLTVKLTPVTRYETTLSASCAELTRPLDKGFVNLRVFAKTATMQNYRQIGSLKNLEPCKILEDPKRFPVMGFFFEGAKKLYPEYVHPCPFLEVNIHNVSLSFMQNPTDSMLEAFKKMNFQMPNAIYRFEGEGWDGTGDEFHASIWIEAKYRKRMTQDLSDL